MNKITNYELGLTVCNDGNFNGDNDGFDGVKGGFN